ncbi:MAG TPA: GTP cyclohydrolase II [Deltaproteobacteria bacterium]|nr:GTP cyclohydrolase II [Candidatus Binatota bacterium]HIL14261.1 GTP cyclohydrolase II [Deltaproteobacteria bacterium]
MTSCGAVALKRMVEVKKEKPVELAVSALAAGRVVLLTDREHPERGASVCVNPGLLDADTINFFVSHARGLVCLAMTEQRMQQLGIPLLADDSAAEGRPVFGASIEAAEGVSTGISAADRARTILVASHPDSDVASLVMPGHVHSVRVSDRGSLVTAAPAEAAADLVAMTGSPRSAAFCCVLGNDGEVADEAELRSLAERFSLPMVDVSEVVDMRLKTELVVERVAEREIDSAYGGRYRAVVYRNEMDEHEHVALVAGVLDGPEPIWVRVHSQCLTGDVLGSARCDCGEQLAMSLEMIARSGRGVVVYMHQEGRGIGLANKIKAYHLQDQGRDTVEANLDLGFGEDLRDYGMAAQILKDLGVARVCLLTNNPAKVSGLKKHGINVIERRPLQPPARSHNVDYLKTKKQKLGHLLDSGALEIVSRENSGGE